MEFEWDERKRMSNIKKHGIDFIDARLLFRLPHAVKPLSYAGEPRWMAIGRLQGRFISIVYTKRGEAVRIISARRANKYEQKES